MLDAIGIDEIEAGTPAMGVKECETIRSIVHLGLLYFLIIKQISIFAINLMFY
jgi:isopropylmalate/homocitrate/citramalate synthase